MSATEQETIDIACDRCGGHGHVHPNRLAVSRLMQGRAGPRGRGQSTRKRVEEMQLVTETCSKCDGSGIRSGLGEQ